MLQTCFICAIYLCNTFILLFFFTTLHKFKINYFNLVSYICGSILDLIISHLCIRTFDLMSVLAANKSIMRSKLPNNALFKFWSHDPFVICKNDHEMETLKSIIRQFRSQKNTAIRRSNRLLGISISWKMTKIWSHEFDIMKKWILI